MQVGDIFWDNEAGQSLVITFEKYDMFWGLWETGQSFSCWTAEDFNGKKYLGKSKANINELFEVKDNEPDFSKMTTREILQYKYENERRMRDDKSRTDL